MGGTGGESLVQLQLQCVYDGSISGHHTEVERRPYHRNCGCAFHKRGGAGGGCPHPPRSNSNVSYPIRRSWSEGSLCLSMGASSSSSPAGVSLPNLYGSGLNCQ